METSQRDASHARSVLVALFLAVGGIVASQITTIPALLLDPTFAESPADASRAATAAFMVLNFVGFFLVGGLYLWRTGRGWSFIDLRVPTLREWGYAAGGVVAAFVAMVGVSLASQLLELPRAENQAIELVGGDPTMVLIMIAIVFFFNAPAEEFLFRNVVQKRLYAAFSRWGAILVTSLIFAAIHIPTYGLTLDGTAAPASAIAVTMIVMFAGSVIFGYVYAATDNLVVPIVAHAVYNGVQFGLLYLLLRYGPDEFEGAMAAVDATVAALATFPA